MNVMLFSMLLMPHAEPAHAEAITYSKHIAPILATRCAGCHRPGEIGPFSLLTYKDASRRAKHLKEVAASRRMPPWLPEASGIAFADERRLSKEELNLLVRWVDAGAPEGDPHDLPPAPKFSDGWQLGEPDLIIKMPKPFTVAADGPDIYQAFVLPIPLDEQRWVKGYEFRPGNRRIVHHVNLLLDTSGEMRKWAEKENGPGFRTTAGSEARQSSSGSLGGWRPGSMPRFLPEGVSMPVRPGTDLVLNVHYHPVGKVEMDQSSLGLYFSKTPSRKLLFPMPMFVSPVAGNADLLDIPAGEKDHKVTLSRVVPADAVAYWITPHAHYLLRRLAVTATLPDGKVLPLLEIKHWDFNWQDRYYYAEPLRLPKGTRLEMTGHFDNSADNPQNPNHPPKRVRWGENSTDEMFAMMLAVTPEGNDSPQAYRKAFWGGGGGGASEEIPKKLQLPPGGFALPEDAKMLREKYDINKDGKLSQEELEAIPQPLRKQVEDRIRERLAASAKPSDKR